MDSIISKRIVIIDDHPIFREGFKSIIKSDNRFRVVGESGSSNEGAQMIHQLKPDLVVTEIWVENQNAVHIIHELKHAYPRMPVIILTMHRATQYVIQALGAGAGGFFLKNSKTSTFLNGCKKILRGERLIDNTFSPDQVANIWEAVRANEKTSRNNSDYLTAREKEVIHLIAEGFPRKEIAKMLCISPKTVENHVTRIMGRLSLHSTIELIRWAAGLGLINMDEWVGTSRNNRYPEMSACR